MNTFSRTALKTISGGGVLATALVAFAGAPAHATPTCDAGNTIAADEAALRLTLASTGIVPIICITAGVIDFSSAGEGGAASISLTQDVTLIGLGDVVFDGGGEINLLETSGASAVNLTVENITFKDGYSSIATGMTNDAQGGAINFNSPGTLTVIDSTFTGNGGYGAAIISGYDEVATTVINNSTFTGNGWVDSSFSAEGAAAVEAYGDLTITNSTFISNRGGDFGAVRGAEALSVSSSLFLDNKSLFNGGAISARSNESPVNISNNTFLRNTAESYGGAVYLDRDGSVANNTFVDNDATSVDAEGDAIYKESSNVVGLFGNIFAHSSALNAVPELDGDSLGTSAEPYVDFGANISTSPTDSSRLPVSKLVTGQVGATYESLGLNALAANGGPTETMALSAGSIAIDAATMAIRTAASTITQPIVDQRGVARGDASDAGAYEFVAPPALANTGLNPLGALALGGGAALAGASALLAAKGRRGSASTFL
jgi:hypothetical protein